MNGAVTFWFALTGVLTAAFVLWYAWAKPPRRFRPPDPAQEVHLTRWKCVVTWDTTQTRKNCPACLGSGILLYKSGQRYAIPRHQWEKALWAVGNRIACDICFGLGLVGKNLIPARLYPPYQGKLRLP